MQNPAPSPASFRLTSPWLGLYCALAAWATAACGAPDQQVPSFSRTDSSGVEIAESFKPRWREDEGWKVADEPRVVIGLPQGEDPYLLDRVMGATITEEGRIVVANGRDCSLRFYDEDGAFLWASGGCGQGPEEFERILGLYRVGDEIYVWQYPGSSLKVFNADGEFLGSAFPHIPTGLAFAQAVGVFADGSLLLANRHPSRTEIGPYLELRTLVRVTATGIVDTFAILPYTHRVPHQSGFGDIQRPGMFLSIYVQGNRVYHSWPERYEISVLDSTGDLLQKIRRHWISIPVGEEYIDRERTTMIRGEGGVVGPPDLLKGIADEMVFSDDHPAHHGILVDLTGHLWVLRTDPQRGRYFRNPPPIFDKPGEWDVFDPRGVWLGGVTTPPRFRVYEFGTDYVAGVFSDDVEVEYVRVYDLSRE